MKKTSKIKDKYEQLGLTKTEVNEFLTSLKNGVWEQMAGYTLGEGENTQNKSGRRSGNA